MKKILAICLIISMFLNCPTYISASDNPQNAEYVYFDDGSYIVSVISKDDSNISQRSMSTLSGTKTSTFHNADDEVMWYIKVFGTFDYGDGAAYCTSVHMEAESNVSTWKLSERTAYRSGDTASASVVAKQYFTFVVIKTMEETVSLTCSPTGVLS